MIQFIVYGLPQPKGSARAFIPKGWTRPVITSTNKNLKTWAQQIATAAQVHATGTLLTEPLLVSLGFYLPRPASLAQKRVFPTSRPDLDKLIRGATDALTHVLWHDDSQVVAIYATKSYCAPNEAPRVDIKIIPMAQQLAGTALVRMTEGDLFHGQQRQAED